MATNVNINNVQQSAVEEEENSLNLVNFDINDAVKILRDKEIEFEIDGLKKNAVVVGQKEFIDEKGVRKIKLITSGGEFGSSLKESALKMPELQGVSMRKCIKLLSALGIEYQINGYGKVMSQNPEPGTVLNKNQVIVINCGNPN
jgi:beta-lactam-binding protein with PASTA domain